MSSKVGALVGDYLKLDLKQVVSFDIVLYLGVLYHMENLLEALKQVAVLTREVAIIETAAILLPGYEHHAICEFFETSELDGDMSNWWTPNEKSLVGMCRAAGFKRAEMIAGPPQ